MTKGHCVNVLNANKQKPPFQSRPRVNKSCTWGWAVFPTRSCWCSAAVSSPNPCYPTWTHSRSFTALPLTIAALILGDNPQSLLEMSNYALCKEIRVYYNCPIGLSRAFIWLGICDTLKEGRGPRLETWGTLLKDYTARGWGVGVFFINWKMNKKYSTFIQRSISRGNVAAHITVRVDWKG